MDLFPGVPALPITLNKFAYAANNPTNTTDPQGTEDLISLETAQSMVEDFVVQTVKSDVMDALLGDADENDPKKPQTLFEILVSQLIGAFAGSGSSDAENTSNGVSAAALGLAALSRVGSTGDHHTIPIYMCGANSQTLVRLPKPEHDKLHAELYAFKVAVNIGANAYALIYRKRRKKEAMSPIAQVARTSQGRAAISAGLALFYQSNGYAWSGSSVPQNLPLMSVFMSEVPKFIGSNHSFPGCKR